MALVAVVLAGVLWGLRKQVAPVAVLGVYAVISGLARFLVEEIRINPEILLGMTQPQLWSLIVIGVGLLPSNRVRTPADDAMCDDGDSWYAAASWPARDPGTFPSRASARES